ncbi:MAG TPA: aspartate-semialdehyde dehydrogenase [Candidatus Galloscillospira excrementipullorum]|nr:aspartate-semialdehyde dehydrogenase [Candidatus Galloscillospira excrementipullorum]
MKEYRVAILGATGAVGREMMRVLEERQFPLSELRLLASARSAGSRLPFRGEELVLEQATPQSFAGCDIVLGAAENDVATELLPHAVAQGAVVIDNSSAYRLDPEVPLVVPEVNPQDISWHKGLISNPNCTTIITATAVAAIHRLSPIVKMTASTYQAVSGAGVGGMRELEQQVEALSKGEPVVCSTFPYQIAYNLIPQIGSFDAQGYSSEEMKLQNEGRKILHADNLLVTCTCVRVPVMRSHSVSVSLETEAPLSLEQVRHAIANSPGCLLVDDPANKRYPMPLDTSDQDLVYVGRIRRDLTSQTGGIALWCCGDQIRKGAATNAVQIAQLLIAQ